MIRTFRGFHGTRAEHVDSILANGLQPSRDPDEWLGDGSYYFIEGLEDPWTSARDWARVSAWDKPSRRFAHLDFAVIEFEIAVAEDALFDFRVPSEAVKFQVARDAWIAEKLRLRAVGPHRPEMAEAIYDAEMLNSLKIENGIAAMISTFPIQLTVEERWFRFETNLDNVVVLCLSHPVVPPTTIDVVGVDIVTFEEIDDSGSVL